MNPLFLLSVLLVGVPVAGLAWSLLTSDQKGRVATPELLNRGAALAGTVAPPRTSVLEAVGRRLAPPAYVALLDRLLSLAGQPASMPLSKVLSSKLAIGLAGAFLGIYLAAVGSTPMMKLAGIFVLSLGYFIPDLTLYSKRPGAPEGHAAGTGQQLGPDVDLCPSRGPGRHLRPCHQPGAADPGQGQAGQAGQLVSAGRGKGHETPRDDPLSPAVLIQRAMAPDTQRQGCLKVSTGSAENGLSRNYKK
jgi:hypothetical protein